ncbi:MAG: transketolase [bacterium]
MNDYIDNLCINGIRMTSMYAINKAKSGHPGIALGAAPIIHTLYTRHLIADANVPNWINRDRFILSAGHGSSMLYSTLHMAGYAITMEDMKAFRQFGSITPGHPEPHLTPGVDVATGPLGSGLATAVGLTIATSIVGGAYNKYSLPLFDNYTYVLCGDGDLQEGVAIEAMTIAGTLELEKLIVLYDSNDIQLDGRVDECHKVNTENKFRSLGWEYILVEDGNSVNDIDEAIKLAKTHTAPTIIEIKTEIGFGSSMSGDSSVHGSPLGDALTKELATNLEWNFEPFELPRECYEFYDETFGARGAEINNQFNINLSNYIDKYGKNYEQITSFLNNDYKLDFSKVNFDSLMGKPIRDVSGVVLTEICRQIPFIVGGSADVAKASKIRGANGNYGADNKYGKNILFGVREHAMGAIANGITLYGGLTGLASTFMAFSDYMKPTFRMAALMKVPTVFIFSHDSLAVGEDGATHQPIEQLTMMRSIPNFNVIRPCDVKEVVQGMEIAFLSKETPTAIITTRQNIDMYENKGCNVSNGAYIIHKEKGALDAVIVASGSEVSLAIKTAEALSSKLKIRVVSMPSMFLFDKQKAAYKESVLPSDKPIIAVEMGHPMPWYKYTPNVYGVEEFGVSAPAAEVLNHFGFTVEKFSDYVTNIIKPKTKK